MPEDLWIKHHPVVGVFLIKLCIPVVDGNWIKLYTSVLMWQTISKSSYIIVRCDYYLYYLYIIL